VLRNIYMYIAEEVKLQVLVTKVVFLEIMTRHFQLVLFHALVHSYFYLSGEVYFLKGTSH